MSERAHCYCFALIFPNKGPLCAHAECVCAAASVCECALLLLLNANEEKLPLASERASEPARGRRVRMKANGETCNLFAIYHLHCTFSQQQQQHRLFQSQSALAAAEQPVLVGRSRHKLRLSDSIRLLRLFLCAQAIRSHNKGAQNAKRPNARLLRKVFACAPCNLVPTLASALSAAAAAAAHSECDGTQTAACEAISLPASSTHLWLSVRSVRSLVVPELIARRRNISAQFAHTLPWQAGRRRRAGGRAAINLTSERPA